MIRPNVRASFGRQEAELLLAMVGGGGERKLRDGGLDALLDDPRVLHALVHRERISRVPAPLFMYVLVRHALLQREILDRQLADYTSAVLIEFGAESRAHRISPQGESFYYLTDILQALERARGEQEFQLRLHLGNFALWLAGIFPDHISHRVQRRGAPPIAYYDQLGASGFRMAAGSELALRHGLGEVLLGAADRFQDLRSALNSLSDTVFFPQSRDAVERLLRQVSDDFDRSLRR
jgi:hypothetical protein